MNDEKPIPLWQRILAGAYALGIVAVLVVFHSRLSADFWPPDASRIAPNIVASIVIATLLTVIGVLLWPPTRRRLHRFVDQKLAPLHHKHAEHAGRIDELHQKLDRLLERDA